jgi:hypothetical protein
MEVDHALADQFVEDIVVELDPLASTGALDVLEEIDPQMPYDWLIEAARGHGV